MVSPTRIGIEAAQSSVVFLTSVDNAERTNITKGGRATGHYAKELGLKRHQPTTRSSASSHDAIHDKGSHEKAVHRMWLPRRCSKPVNSRLQSRVDSGTCAASKDNKTVSTRWLLSSRPHPPHLPVTDQIPSKTASSNQRSHTTGSLYAFETPQSIVDQYEQHHDLSIKSKTVFHQNDRFVFSRVLDSDALLFDSNFESGNLESATRVYSNRAEEAGSLWDQEYDLRLATDTHTSGYLQWFFFSVSNTQASVSYRLNLLNMKKATSLYNQGMLPVVYSVKEHEATGRGWHRCGQYTAYYEDPVVVRKSTGKPQRRYRLTFIFTPKHEQDTVYIAYHFPYTYSMSKEHVKMLVQSYSFVRRHVLCKTMAGNEVELLTITAPASTPEELQRRKIVVLTARVHPGESNSSFVMQGILDSLVNDSEKSRELRRLCVFKIVPMLNPDGVIAGNYRTSVAGVDLNRRWAEPDESIHPEIYYTKKLLEGLRRRFRAIDLYCDFHGHSRQEGMFMYGCDPQRYWSVGESARLPVVRSSREFLNFPSLLADETPMFKLEKCRFGLQRYKAATARIVVWKELEVASSFTLESSFLGADGRQYGIEELSEFGTSFTRAIHRWVTTEGSEVSPTLASFTKTYFSKRPTKRQLNGNQSVSGMDSNSDSGSDSEPSDDNLDVSSLAQALRNSNLNIAASAMDRLRKLSEHSIARKTKKTKSKVTKSLQPKAKETISSQLKRKERFITAKKLGTAMMDIVKSGSGHTRQLNAYRDSGKLQKTKARHASTNRGGLALPSTFSVETSSVFSDLTSVSGESKSSVEGGQDATVVSVVDVTFPESAVLSCKQSANENMKTGTQPSQRPLREETDPACISKQSRPDVDSKDGGASGSPSCTKNSTKSGSLLKSSPIKRKKKVSPHLLHAGTSEDMQKSDNQSPGRDSVYHPAVGSTPYYSLVTAARLSKRPSVSDAKSFRPLSSVRRSVWQLLKSRTVSEAPNNLLPESSLPVRSPTTGDNVAASDPPQNLMETGSSIPSSSLSGTGLHSQSSLYNSLTIALS